MSVPKDRKEIGRRLAIYRKSRRLSQEEVATKAGINTHFLSRIETGAGNTTLNTLLKIARAMGAPLHEILGSDLVSGKASEDEALRELAAKEMKKVAGPELRVFLKLLRLLKADS